MGLCASAGWMASANLAQASPACHPQESAETWRLPGHTPSLAFAGTLQELQGDLVLHVFSAPHITLEATDEPQFQARAVLGTGVIQVSRALEGLAWTDDERYAILAHEAFHHVLHNAAPSCGEPYAATVLQTQELEADREASELMRKTGRDPLALARVLERLNALRLTSTSREGASVAAGESRGAQLGVDVSANVGAKVGANAGAQRGEGSKNTSTHPSTSARIDALNSLTYTANQTP